MRVYAYRRVSHADSVEQYSLDAQSFAIEQYARMRGWEIAQVFTDPGVSAYTDDPEARPAFSRLMAEIDARRCDVVLCAKLDRFARSVIVAVSQLKRILAANCALIDIASGVDYSTASGRMLFGMLSVVAENEAAMISERSRAGIAQKKRSGKHVGGIPWGALRDADSLLQIDPTHAETFERLLTMAATESSGRIAAAFNRDGIPAPKGGTWEPPVIHRKIRDGAWLLLQPDPWPSLWLAAINRPRQPASNWNKNPKMLTGLLRCACGGIIVNVTTVVRPNGLVYHPIQCRHYTKERPTGARCPYRKTGRQAYEKAFTAWLYSLPPLDRPGKRHQPVDDVAAVLADIKVRRIKAGAKLDADAMTLDQFREAIAQLNAEEAALRAPAMAPASLALAVQATQAAWLDDDLSDAERNKLARRLFKQITIAGRVMMIEPIAELRALLDEQGFNTYTIGA